MPHPEVTIITPCYNARKYIQQCVQSVQSQGFESWEHLIIDDQSNDGSRDIVAGYQQRDDRVKLLTSSNKLGASKARNLAIKSARGRYIAFLDADDWWSADKLSKQVALMQSTSAKFSCTAYTVVNEAGELLRVQNVDNLDLQSLLTKRVVVGCLTVLYDRKYFEDFLFSEDMKAAEDYEMWCRMMIHLAQNGGECAAISEPLAHYRMHPGGKSYRKFRRIQLHYDIYRKRLRLPLVYSVRCTLNYMINGIRDRI